jgi:hypothetical protein
MALGIFQIRGVCVDDPRRAMVHHLPGLMTVAEARTRFRDYVATTSGNGRFRSPWRYTLQRTTDLATREGMGT